MSKDVLIRSIAFRDGLPGILNNNVALVTSKNSEKIDDAYCRLTFLQAMRTYILDSSASDGAVGFFHEAQSDGLTSEVLVNCGLLRSALKSLRSLIENVVRSVYYADHPIEYRLWDMGLHRPQFRELFEYIKSHPDIQYLPDKLQCASTLHATWQKLSEAVHASAKKERMSEDLSEITLWKTDQASVGLWHAFQKSVLRDVCVLYLALYRDKLGGAAFPGLRQAAAYCLPKSLDKTILSAIGVNVTRA